MSNHESLTAESVRTVWARYRGIADEYVITKARWQFLSDRFSLPDLTVTFQTLDQVKNRIDTQFLRYFQMQEKQPETADPIQNTSTIQYRHLYDQICRFYDYSAKIRKCFLDRTVSAQVPYTGYEVPHSLERTIANELFYIAADRILGDYVTHVSLRRLRWDGVVSFIPPQNGQFSGGFYSSIGSVFHVSLSEETKYFAGHYLTLAHELGHAVMDDSGIGSRWRLFMSTKAAEIREICPKGSMCSPLFNVRHYMLEQIMADVIGLKVAGINVVREFLDYTAMTYPVNLYWGPSALANSANIYVDVAPNFDIMRVLALAYYVIASDRYESWWPTADRIRSALVSEVHRHLVEVPQVFDQLLEDHSNAIDVIEPSRKLSESVASCVRCIVYRLAAYIAACILDFEEEQGANFGGVISNEFQISDNEEAEIRRNLLSGNVRSDVSPCKILHTYYSLYGEGSRINYGTVIANLVESNRHTLDV